MLRFRLDQIQLLSAGRYFLPLPKLAEPQLAVLSSHLEERGFSVRRRSNPGRLTAQKGGQRIAIDGSLGLASSSADMLDALAPAVPRILAFPGTRTGIVTTDVASLYFSMKRFGASSELQLFPRLESLKTWTLLRKEGLCGLTPDEAAVLRHLLGKASASSRVECITARPRDGSRTLQFGRNVYYRSSIPIAEFLGSLRTIESEGAESATYVPRDSVIALSGARVDTDLTADELGEWCYLA